MSDLAYIPRWVAASIYKYLYDASVDLYPLHIEGQLPSNENTHPPPYAELRFDGPYFREVSAGYFYIYAEVNVLCSVPVQANFYKIQEILGHFADLLSKPIPVYKYGDDESLLFCMLPVVSPQGTKANELRINNFGVIELDKPLIQGSVEGHYETWHVLT